MNEKEALADFRLGPLLFSVHRSSFPIAPKNQALGSRIRLASSSYSESTEKAETAQQCNRRTRLRREPEIDTSNLSVHLQ